MPELWEIVGGDGRGGIIVREQVDLGSAKLSTRLRTGAIVEEINLVGERLHYQLVSGSGPPKGWISIAVSSSGPSETKVLAKRVANQISACSSGPATSGQPALSEGQVGSSKSVDDKKDVLTEFEGLPFSRFLFEAEVIAFCKAAVPAWRALPEDVAFTCSKLHGGASSRVILVEVSADTIPLECVYSFSGSIADDAEQLLLSIAVGKSGAAPKLYAAIGKHRVMEYVDGTITFGGPRNSHYLMIQNSSWSGNFEEGPANPDLMKQIGRALGLVHALPLDFLLNASDPLEFARRLSNPVYHQRAHTQAIGMCKSLTDRLPSSKVIPRAGLFEKPVVCHGDLHGGNILSSQCGAKIIDWESVILAHRGVDLAYFFLCAPGATLTSRRVWASAYLSMHEPRLAAEPVDDFLLDVERCIPLGLIHMICLSVATMADPLGVRAFVNYVHDVLNALEVEPDLMKVNRSEVLDAGVLEFLHSRHKMKRPVLRSALLFGI